MTEETFSATSGPPPVVAERNKYEPFGEHRAHWALAQPLPRRHTLQSTLGFTGQEPDDGVGLTNMQGRLYDQRLGRFLSHDTFVGAEGPQSLNRYSYVSNSPLMRVDPFGLQEETISDCLGGDCAGPGGEERETLHRITLRIREFFGSAPTPEPLDPGEATARDVAAMRAEFSSGVSAAAAWTDDNTRDRAPETVVGQGEYQTHRARALEATAQSLEGFRGPAEIAANANPVMAIAGVYSGGSWTGGDLSTEQKVLAVAGSGLVLVSAIKAFFPRIPALARIFGRPQISAAGDHIVLGLRNYGLESTAAKVGGRTLLSDPNWKRSLAKAIADPSTRFSVSVDGLAGASAAEKVLRAAEQGIRPGATPTNWEPFPAVSGWSPTRRHLLGARCRDRESVPMKTVLGVQGRVEWWMYTVSHGQLLLRRAKSPPHSRRLDILFKNVVEAHLTTYFDNLRVLELLPGDAELAPFGTVGDRKVFKLLADNASGHVIAGSITHGEDDLEYYDPSPLLR